MGLSCVQCIFLYLVFLFVCFLLLLPSGCAYSLVCRTGGLLDVVSCVVAYLWHLPRYVQFCTAYCLLHTTE